MLARTPTADCDEFAKKHEIVGHEMLGLGCPKSRVIRYCGTSQAGILYAIESKDASESF